jgi:proton-translocating NAD(P)+ transhydrogenase subunit beta
MSDLIQSNILEICYLIASITFILGLKMLSHPHTARKGNLIAAFGMGLAIVATILFHKKEGEHIQNLVWIIGGIVVGTVIGTLMAKKIKMTAMPQMVSFFNGMGGGTAALIAIIEFNHFIHIFPGASMMDGEVLVMLAGLLIGSVSFSGSIIAYGKLEGKIKDKIFPMQHIINLSIFAIIIALGAYIMITGNQDPILLYIMVALSLFYGVMFVLPIGGADMPVVISLLNSFTGVAAALGGFLYGNQVMLTGGILVGSAGTILTILMCKAMNRSLTNVLIGAFSASSGGVAKGEGGDKSINEATPTDVAILCTFAQNVVIVPGYGLAVAQAQHTVNEFEQLLESKGVNVKYAIHPVAGRMPGHMNVLLAEADVPYDKLFESDDINPQMPNTDVVLVIGANDVVNPAAEDDPNSPIYGMPIIQAYKAKNTVILKRGMSAGYAGIQNDLFFRPNTSMLFGDAKDSIQKLIEEVKAL